MSSSTRERAALLSLCESAGWVASGADTLRTARRALIRLEPRVIISRHVIEDGHADHLLRDFATGARGVAPRLVVLGGPAMPASEEARQVTLGADCVLRDPVRTDVLLAHLSRYLRRNPGTPRATAPGQARMAFAGGELRPDDRTLRRGRRKLTLTPREAELAEALASRPEAVVTYEILYAEILGRRFRGETSNLRVLLGKLAGTCRTIGIELRDWVEVIPKSGYRYHPVGRGRTP